MVEGGVQTPSGIVKRVMFFLPPGAAKSTYASVGFPPYFMGRKPRQQILACSFEQSLARSFGRRCRSVAKSEDFRDIFGIGLSAETSAADEWDLQNDSGYLGRGIRAGITGRRCDVGIIDDPVRNRADADSEAISTATWEEYNSSFLTRLKPDAWQMLIQTRWSHLDLAGRLLPDNYDGRTGIARCKDGHYWYVVNLPMICERRDDPLGRAPGDLLWPEWFKAEDMFKIRDNPARARDWASLYQQRPSLDEGLFFKKEWFGWYPVVPEYCRFYGASDFAITSNGGDWTVHLVFAVCPVGNIYIVKVWRQQCTTDVGVDAMLDLMRDYDTLNWATDRDQIVNSIGPFIRRRMEERKIYGAMEQFSMGRQDKAMRARSFQGQLALGATGPKRVFLPTISVDASHPWVEEYVRELTQFPTAAHDDQVDASGLVGRLLDSMVEGHIPPPAVVNHLDDYVEPGRSDAPDNDWQTV